MLLKQASLLLLFSCFFQVGFLSNSFAQCAPDIMQNENTLDNEFPFIKHFYLSLNQIFLEPPSVESLTAEKKVAPLKFEIPNINYGGFHPGDSYKGFLNFYDVLHLNGTMILSTIDPNVYLSADQDIALNTFNLENQYSFQFLTGVDFNSKLIFDETNSPDLFGLNPQFGFSLKRDAYSLKHAPGFSFFRLMTGVGPMLESHEDSTQVRPSVSVTGALQIGL